MRTWIFVDGVRTEPADTDCCFTITSVSELVPMGFMQSETDCPKWDDCVKVWKSLYRFANKVKGDYLAIYQRECWVVKDSDIHTLESFQKSRDNMRELGKVYSYWGK